MAQRIGFKNWLVHYKGSDHLIQDLAFDAKFDRTWPKGKMTRERLLSYLDNCGAVDGAIEAAKRAWKEYQEIM